MFLDRISIIVSASGLLAWFLLMREVVCCVGCAPNVRKERAGRALQFYTTVDVGEGEELCINYVDVQEEVGERRGQLLDNWYFDCVCERCEKELASGSIAKRVMG